MTIYGAWFYDAIRTPVQASVAALVPLVYERLKPRTVIDVGCGEGWWALGFAELGSEVIGIDGPYVDDPALGDRFIPADLEMPLPAHLAGRFDLAVSLEVAEHLTPARAASFVADLCALAPVVLFSAAIPGQGGNGHINCQWASWWAEHFAVNGFDLDGSIRHEIWNDDRIEPWYRQNLHIATKGGTGTTLDLVHPVIYGWGR